MRVTKFYKLSEKHRLMIIGAIHMEHQLYKKFYNTLNEDLEFLWPDRDFGYGLLAKRVLQNLDLQNSYVVLPQDEAQFIIDVITWTKLLYMQKVAKETIKENADPIYLDLFQFVDQELQEILTTVKDTLVL